MSGRVLVVGGAGYIGSHMVKLLLAEGEQVIVLDDLSSGHRDAVSPGALFIRGNSGDGSVLDRLFQRHAIDTVLHFASNINVGESIVQPGGYYANNVGNTVTLLNAIARHRIPHLVFSSTAAVFGTPLYTPIDENHPQEPINPYGRSKWFVEKILPDYERAYGLRYVCLRYFNAAGADPDGQLGERHNPETHLIPLALRAAAGHTEYFTVYGDDYDTPDGTCIRDYIHVSDLCTAHLLAIRYLRNARRSQYINLGNGNGYSVYDVLKAVRSITQRTFAVKVIARRPGDPPSLVADASAAHRLLGWNPQYPELHDIVAHAFVWEQVQEERHLTIG